MPKTVVIMPVHNAKDYVEKAISSVSDQTYKDFGLLYIVDCPTDIIMRGQNE